MAQQQLIFANETGDKKNQECISKHKDLQQLLIGVSKMLNNSFDNIDRETHNTQSSIRDILHNLNMLVKEVAIVNTTLTQVLDLLRDNETLRKQDYATLANQNRELLNRFNAPDDNDSDIIDDLDDI